MNATLELVSPRGATVSPSERRWFEASGSEEVTFTEEDWLFTREVQVHQPGQSSATTGWPQAYHRQMPKYPRYYGRSANSTAASFPYVILSGGGSAQSDFSQSGQDTSPASTDVHILSTGTLVAELQELRGLSEGWDGEAAAAPIPGAINDALSFVRAARDLAARLEPTLHVDGSVILEVGDGSEGSLRFQGDHTITYAIRGFTPGVARFDGKAVPKEILATLAAVS